MNPLFSQIFFSQLLSLNFLLSLPFITNFIIKALKCLNSLIHDIRVMNDLKLYVCLTFLSLPSFSSSSRIGKERKRKIGKERKRKIGKERKREKRKIERKVPEWSKIAHG